VGVDSVGELEELDDAVSGGIDVSAIASSDVKAEATQLPEGVDGKRAMISSTSTRRRSSSKASRSRCCCQHELIRRAKHR
jgi:hypothetical protein